MHPMYSLDIINDILVFNNAWDYNRANSNVDSNYTGRYVLFNLNNTSSSLVPSTRYYYDSNLDFAENKIVFSQDSNINLNSIAFYFYKCTNLDLQIPTDFNPNNSIRVDNIIVLWENMTDENFLYSGGYT